MPKEVSNREFDLVFVMFAQDLRGIFFVEKISFRKMKFFQNPVFLATREKTDQLSNVLLRSHYLVRFFVEFSICHVQSYNVQRVHPWGRRNPASPTIECA